MNSPNLGTPLIKRPADDHLTLPKPPTPTLVERIAASHAEVLDKWHKKFALDLRRPAPQPVRTA
jgi:hypothetical protein